MGEWGVVLVSFAELFVIGSRPKDVATTTLFARRMVFEQGIQQSGRKPEEAFLQYINFLYRVYKYLRVFICGERPGTLIFAHRWEQVKRFQKSLSLRTIIAGGCRNPPPSPQINRCPYREVAKLPPCCNGGQSPFEMPTLFRLSRTAMCKRNRHCRRIPYGAPFSHFLLVMRNRLRLSSSTG